MLEKIYSNIGEKIASIRKQRGLSQQDLANKLGLGRSTVTKYENNLIELSFTQVIEIANALDLTLFELIVEADDSDLEYKEVSKGELNKKIQQLEKELFAKDRIIADKEKIIELYEQTLIFYKKEIEDAAARYHAAIKKLS